MLTKIRQPEQGEFEFPTWGGKRKRAGRPKTRPDLQPHTPRVPVARSYPVHVSIKLAVGRRSLRTYALLAVVRSVLRAIHAKRDDFRVPHFSLQDSHLHLLVEGDSPAAFTSGPRSLCIRVARRL